MSNNYSSIIYRNNPNAYKTTYGLSYQGVPTFYASPRYEDERKRLREPNPHDIPPYDDIEYVKRRDEELRELERRKLAELYRQEQELEEARQENERIKQGSPYRNRPRGDSPQRYSYNEPISHGSRYDQDIDRGHDFREAPMSYRNGDAHIDEGQTPRRPNFQAEYIQPDLQPEPFNEADVPRFCNRCFKGNVCINKFKCGHQYCDDCMKKLKGAENPFRGAWLWHFKCAICKNDEWCSEQRLVRYDAKGRRIVRYKDVKYIDS